MPKICCIADIHNRKLMDLPQADILIVAGDLTENGSMPEFKRMAEYINGLDYKYKILVWGNHDRLAELLYPETILNRMFKNCQILTNKPYYNREYDLSFYGTPINAKHDNWAFQPKEEKREELFKMIPRKIDILVTHTPPFGILDPWEGQNIGDKALLKVLEHKVFKYHIFGHAHEGYGQITIGEKTYINCSIMNKDYQPKNKPVLLEI